MGIAGPHPGGAPARRRKRCPAGAGAPTPRGGGGVGVQRDPAYRLGKVRASTPLGKIFGLILHGVVERERGSRGGDGVDIGGIGWAKVDFDSSFTPDPPIVSDSSPIASRLRARRVCNPYHPLLACSTTGGSGGEGGALDSGSLKGESGGLSA